MTGTTKWILDPNETLPLAIIEDTEDGMSVQEFPDRSPESFAQANLLIKQHNDNLERR